MPPPRCSVPARITVWTGLPSPAPQPSDRAASAASRPISAAFSRASASKSPLFPPSAAEAASGPAGGRVSQIFSFTSAICPTVAANSACRAISRRIFSTSTAASCGPILFARPSNRVHKNRGPWPGWPGRAQAQFGLPHLR